MARIVIACYRPKPGRNAELRELTRSHVPTLRAEGLVTDRPSVAMEAADGTVVEVFEWSSQDAIDLAHQNPVVLAMWERYADVCDYVPVGELEEASHLFSDFRPME